MSIEPSASDVLSSDELKRRWLAIVGSMEAMSNEAAKLLSVIEPAYLPLELVNEIEAKLRPFASAVRQMTTDCAAYQDYASRFEAKVTSALEHRGYDA